MEQNSTNKVAAEVSIRESGALYVGVSARRKLKAGLDDKVKVELPELGRVVEGALDSSSHIQVGKELSRAAFDGREERRSATEHAQAIVEKLPGTWDDDHELTDQRHERTYYLKSKGL